MLIWQVADGHFYSINLHHDNVVLWIHVDITVEKQLYYCLYLMYYNYFYEFTVFFGTIPTI